MNDIEENKLPEKIYPVNYAGFWDFSPDGYYGDSLINEMDFPNAEDIADAMAFRYNNFLDLMATLQRVSNCNDLATAREYARESIAKITASNRREMEGKENG